MDLSGIPLIDHHAHNLLTPEAANRSPYRAAFTEGYDPAILSDHAQHSLLYRRSLREIATVLECDPSEEAVLARRVELGYENVASRFFGEANLELIMLDDGFLPGQIQATDWHGRFVPTRRILRVEALAEDLLGSSRGFDDFLASFRAALDPPPANVVGLKTIAAYRTGLDVRQPSVGEARAAFDGWQQSARPGQRPRLADKALLDFLLDQALELAAKRGLPLQVHTGFGDPDLDLRLSNPLHLRRVFEDRRFRNVPIMLLHGSYPFVREAGYLAAVYPNAYLDLGLAIPFLSVAGMRGVTRALLELAPTTKLLYSSDAHLIPELFYLGAKWGRQLLAECLDEAVTDGDLTSAEADEVAKAILRGNARRLYRLGD